jgi:hypothetical protein
MEYHSVFIKHYRNSYPFHPPLGRPLRTVVLLQGVDPTLRSMEEEPDTFFLVAPVEADFFSKVDIVFKSKDALTKKTFMFSLSGEELLNWLPKHYFVDFKTTLSSFINILKT